MKTNLDIFLKILLREGYPNTNLSSLAKLVSYNSDNLLFDLDEQYGRKKVTEFVEKGLEKFLGDDFIYKLDLEPYGYYNGSYVVFEIVRFNYQPNDYLDGIIVHSNMLDSNICHPDGKCETFEDIYDGADMGEWGEVEELKEEILNAFSHKIHENLGFYLNFE